MFTRATMDWAESFCDGAAAVGEPSAISRVLERLGRFNRGLSYTDRGWSQGKRLAAYLQQRRGGIAARLNGRIADALVFEETAEQIATNYRETAALVAAQA